LLRVKSPYSGEALRALREICRLRQELQLSRTISPKARKGRKS
jgi:hypothetical protein